MPTAPTSTTQTARSSRPATPDLFAIQPDTGHVSAQESWKYIGHCRHRLNVNLSQLQDKVANHSLVHATTNMSTFSDLPDVSGHDRARDDASPRRVSPWHGASAQTSMRCLLPYMHTESTESFTQMHHVCDACHKHISNTHQYRLITCHLFPHDKVLIMCASCNKTLLEQDHVSRDSADKHDRYGRQDTKNHARCTSTWLQDLHVTP
jgi:hypothetical protein